MFGQSNRLTAVAIRLREPEMLRDAAGRLQNIPGAQVVTLTEMMGVFLNLVGSVRVILESIAMLALTVCSLGVFNTMLAAVLERSDELAIMRAVGASRFQVFNLVGLESVFPAGTAAGAGLVLAVLAGGILEKAIKPFLPLAARDSIWLPSGATFCQALLIGVSAGVIAGIYPAWRASRMQSAAALKVDP